MIYFHFDKFFFFILLLIPGTLYISWCLCNLLFFFLILMVSFLRYLDFCVLVQSTDFKICHIIIGIPAQLKLHLHLFLSYPKFHQTCFWLNAGNWKLVPGSFMISLKWKYSEIWPIIIVYIKLFSTSFIHLFKKMKHWNLVISGYWLIGAGC